MNAPTVNDKTSYIIRAARSDNPYFLLSRKTAQDERLDWESLGMLTYLLSKPDNWCIRVADLMKRGGRDKTRRIMKELQDCGYLTKRVRQDDKGLIQGWNWEVHELAVESDEDTVLLETRTTVKPSDGKPTPIHITEEEQITESNTSAQSAEWDSEFASKHDVNLEDKQNTKPVQAHIAIIEAWHSGMPHIGTPSIKPNVRVAMELVKAGIVAADVTRFMTMEYPGYLDWATRNKRPKIMTLQHVKDHIAAFLDNETRNTKRLSSAEEWIPVEPDNYVAPSAAGDMLGYSKRGQHGSTTTD